MLQFGFIRKTYKSLGKDARAFPTGTRWPKRNECGNMGCKSVRHKEGLDFAMPIDFGAGAHYIILPHGYAKTHPHLVQADEERGQ